MKSRSQSQQILVRVCGLSLLWLILSGHYTGLLLSFGALSVAVAILIGLRMRVFDDEMHPAQFHPLRFLRYLVWLAREVVLSALDVSRRVLDPALPLDPCVVRLPVSQRTDLGRSIYANSITLTPGTVSIDLGDDFVEVHALTRDGAEALAEVEMDRLVAYMERED